MRFYSYDGYQVEADFTVVWGRTPADAPNIVANIGNVSKVRANVIEPAMKAACQNEGAKYSARELMQEQQVCSRVLHTRPSGEQSIQQVAIQLAVSFRGQK